jgi:hypothetical protein
MPDPPQDPPGAARVRLGLICFLLGAGDRLWGLKGLDDRAFADWAEWLLGRLGLGPGQAATLVGALPQLPGDPFAARAMAEGGETLEDWLRAHDGNAILRLKELVSDWRRG